MSETPARIAIIGGGPGGLAAAWRLASIADVTVYEAQPQLGGHCRTVDVETPAGVFPLDMGVVLTSPWTYGNVYAALRRFGIGTRATRWSLGASFGDAGAWWAGGDTPLLDAHRDELSRWSEAIALASGRPLEQQLAPVAQLIAEGGFSESFVCRFLAPALALLVVTRSGTDRMPLMNAAGLFGDRQMDFFSPVTWHLIDGGSRALVRALAADVQTVRCGARVQAVRREERGAVVRCGGEEERFDAVVMAVNAQVALALLEDADELERGLLSRYEYQPAEVYLHSDAGVLAPNLPDVLHTSYYDPSGGGTRELAGSLTLDVGRGRGLPFEAGRVLITGYNEDSEMARPEPEKVFAFERWQHHVSSTDAAIARAGLEQIQGRRSTWIAGSVATFPGLEGAFTSGLIVADAMGAPYPFADDGRASRSFGELSWMMFPSKARP